MTLKNFDKKSHNTKKIEGGHFCDFLQKKSHNAEKTGKGDPLVSPGIVC